MGNKRKHVANPGDKFERLTVIKEIQLGKKNEYFDIIFSDGANMHNPPRFYHHFGNRFQW